MATDSRYAKMMKEVSPLHKGSADYNRQKSEQE